MPVLRPFVGTRFSAETGDLNALLFPGDGGPREVFAERSPNNIAHAAIPEGRSDDRSRYIRYARSNAAIFEWQRGSLIQACDGASTFQLLLNNAWLALGLIEIDTPGVESAFEAMKPSEREPALRLLEATRTAFRPTVLLVPERDLEALIREADTGATAEFDLDGEVKGEIAPILDERVSFSFDKAFIVAGEAEWQAARAFRDDDEGDTVPARNLALVALLPSSATAEVEVAHFVFPALPNEEGILGKLSETHHVTPMHSSRLPAWLESHPGSFGVAAEGGEGYGILPSQPATPEPVATDDGQLRAPMSNARMIASFCEGVLDGALELRSAGAEIHYAPAAAYRAANSGGGVAFLLPPLSLTELSDALVAGLRFSRGAFRVSPSIPLGLVFWNQKDYVA